MRRKLFGLVGAAAFILAGCGADSAQSTEEDVLTVGVTSGPHEDIVKKVKEVAAEDGFEIEVVVFDDYVQPNTALAEGDLDANLMQTGPYLQSIIDESGYDLTRIEPMVSFPMGLYSEQYTDVSQFQEGDIVALPNSATQEGRALLLFELAGLITLPDGAGVESTISDIVENPLNLEFLTSDAAQLPIQLPDVAGAAINSNYAVDAGLIPSEDGLFMEDREDLTWVNYFVSRTEDKDNEEFQQFIEYYKTDEIKQFIEEEFKGSVVPAW